MAELAVKTLTSFGAEKWDTTAGERVLDLLRDLAEDRHELGCKWRRLEAQIDRLSGIGRSEAERSPHRGTLRTCPDRFCSEAAELLK